MRTPLFEIGVLLALLGVISPAYAGPEPGVQDISQASLEAMIAQRHEEIGQFMRHLGRAQTGVAPDPEMDLAIKGLGELRAVEAAGQLSRHLMYLPDKLTEDERFTTEMYYPAAVALARIGQRSIQFMVGTIGSTPSHDERNLAAWVIMSVEGKEQALHRLDDLVAKNDRYKPAYAAARRFLADYKLSFALPSRQPAPEDGRQGMTLPPRDNGVILQEIAPAEYDRYRKSLEGGYGLPTVAAALALIAKTEAVNTATAADRSADERKCFHARTARDYAWTHLLEIFHRTSDTNTQSAVLAAWNKAFDGRANISPPMHALNNEWDKAFLTDELRKTFREAKDVERIHLFCLVMGRHGEDSEEALLREKRATLKTMSSDYLVYRACLSNIDGALKKIAYWRAGDKSRVGPAERSYRDDWPF